MTGNVLRGAAFIGLAATSAAVAHGGPAAASDPRWLAAALAGAGLAALVLWQGWRLLLGRGHDHAPAPLPLLIMAMLAAQAVAHVGLLAAGADSHAGTGTLALHLALAVLGAVAVQRIDVRVARQLAAHRTMPAATVVALSAAPARSLIPRGPAIGVSRGRAPPLAL